MAFFWALGALLSLSRLRPAVLSVARTQVKCEAEGPRGAGGRAFTRPRPFYRPPHEGDSPEARNTAHDEKESVKT